MSDVVQRVGEQSRRDGRESVSNKIERLQRERNAITFRKREIEGLLAELESKRKDEQAQLYKRRLNHTDLVVESTLIQSRYSGEKSRLIKDLNNVTEELGIIKKSLSDVQAHVVHPHDQILLRIETLLLAILEKMSRD